MMTMMMMMRMMKTRLAAAAAGDVIRWEQQIRFRHMTTRQYLCITSDRRVTLTPDSKDPRTVFRLHPVIKVRCRLPQFLSHVIYLLLTVSVILAHQHYR